MPSMLRVKLLTDFAGFKKGEITLYPEVLVKQNKTKFEVNPTEPVVKPKARADSKAKAKKYES